MIEVDVGSACGLDINYDITTSRAETSKILSIRSQSPTQTPHVPIKCYVSINCINIVQNPESIKICLPLMTSEGYWTSFTQAKLRNLFLSARTMMQCIVLTSWHLFNKLSEPCPILLPYNHISGNVYRWKCRTLAADHIIDHPQ